MVGSGLVSANNPNYTSNASIKTDLLSGSIDKRADWGRDAKPVKGWETSEDTDQLLPDDPDKGSVFAPGKDSEDIRALIMGKATDQKLSIWGSKLQIGNDRFSVAGDSRNLSDTLSFDGYIG
jgi:hypothetical protein